MLAANALASQYMCTGSHEPSLFGNAVSTKISCADSFTEMANNLFRFKQLYSVAMIFISTHISLSSFFVGHWQIVQTQTRRRSMRRLIRVSTVYLQKVILGF